MDAKWIRDQLAKNPEKTQRGLAKALNKDPAAITRMLQDGREIKAREVPVIEQYFRGAAEAPAFQHRASPAETTDLNIRAMPMDLPVMGSAACGEDGLFEMQGETLDHVRRPPRLMSVKGAYALWVGGESMSPWREHGGLVVVHPHAPIRINDYVVVQLKPAKDGDAIPAYIKRLVRRTAANLVLLQFNPRKEITLPTSKILAVHRILDWDEAMGI